MRIVHLLITFFLVAIQTVTDRKKIFCPKTGEISAENRKICAKTVAGHVSSEQWRVSDTLTTTPHPYTPHCAPLVRGYLRLTARVMPPAWSPDRSGLRGCGAPLFGAACTGCGRFRSFTSLFISECICLTEASTSLPLM